jgi:hypothetical protein
MNYGRGRKLQTFVYVRLFCMKPFCKRFRRVTLDAQGFADGKNLEEEWKIFVVV